MFFEKVFQGMVKTALGKAESIQDGSIVNGPIQRGSLANEIAYPTEFSESPFDERMRHQKPVASAHVLIVLLDPLAYPFGTF